MSRRERAEGAPGAEGAQGSGEPGALVPAGLDAVLALVRHGETEFIAEGRFQGQTETPLTPTGRRQAELAGERLARPARWPGVPIPREAPLEIAHSPLARTRQTAEAIAGAFERAGSSPPLRPEPGLREIGQGAWEGLRQADVAERYAAELSAWRTHPTGSWAPGGEALPDVDARVRAGLRPLLERLAAAGRPGALDRPQVSGYRSGSVDDGTPWAVLVGHDGVFKVALLALLGLPLERFWAFSFPLGGLTVVECRGGRAILRAHGLVDHLAPLAGAEAQSAAEEPARERSGAL